MTEITGDYFPFAERLSAALKEGAILLRGQPLSLELLARVFMPLREVRSGFDELALRQARAMAEPN